jgi:2-polyprenyl-6-methoxyphenol hydroxylase-like FAD-dependent oxidoreductase
MRTQVLIAGAGPTGLVVALWLAKQGVALRIIDDSPGPGDSSRAIAVQARILEFYRQLGIADDVVAAGVRANTLTMRREGRRVATAELSDMGQGRSAYPFVLAFAQDDHERLLEGHLARLGVMVERNTVLESIAQDEGSVRATLRTPGGTEVVEADYLAGCDGARSRTRHELGVAFPGGTYSQLFYVADAMAHGDAASGGVQICISAKDFCLVLPVRRTGSLRLIGIVPPETEKKAEIDFADVTESIVRNTGLALDTVHWFATYRVHHRIAESFRRGRVFLAGDAAHIHSPAGGQGMNTGIGDAVNLAWKLAAVVQGRAAPALLESYAPERMAFARTLVASTDAAFRFITDRSSVGTFLRTAIMPRAFPLAMRLRAARRFLFNVISQIRIRYRNSELSAGRSGRVHGGDRLPWVETAAGDNFAPLSSLDWQVHVYGAARDELRAMLQKRGVPLHVFAWSERAAAAGLAQDAAYLVRPDGHVAVASDRQDVAQLEQYCATFAIVPHTSGLRSAA